ncbi:MAG: hypothetical protein R2692_10100, partial [Microbacterium sp.]
MHGAVANRENLDREATAHGDLATDSAGEVVGDRGGCRAGDGGAEIGGRAVELGGGFFTTTAAEACERQEKRRGESTCFSLHSDPPHDARRSERLLFVARG